MLASNDKNGINTDGEKERGIERERERERERKRERARERHASIL